MVSSLYINICKVICDMFFWLTSHEKILLDLSCGRESKFFNHERSLDMISLRIVQEYNNSLSYHTKNEKEKYSSDLEYNASKENILLWEDKFTKIAKLPSNPACQPLLFLSEPETLTSLSCLLPEAIPLLLGWWWGVGGGTGRERGGPDSQKPSPTDSGR